MSATVPLTVPDWNSDGRLQTALLEVTGLPTASGRERRVIEWIRAWVARRSERFSLIEYPNGNLCLQIKAAPSSGPLTIFEAHMDHPAFVVVDGASGQPQLEFRGTVAPEYFKLGTNLTLHGQSDDSTAAVLLGEKIADHAGPFPRYTFNYDGCTPKVGDIVRWTLSAPHIDEAGLLHTNATDNLACVVAALMAMEQLAQLAASGTVISRVWLLLTRAEEIGFVGLSSHVRGGAIPRDARIIVLENSKALRTIKVGSGVVVRLGDKTSTCFTPSIVSGLAARAEQLTGRTVLGQPTGQAPLLKDPWAWQADLMPGGSCHATLLVSRNYQAGCLVVPLHGYHNQGDDGAVTHETIAVRDVHALVDMLISCGIEFPSPPDIDARIDKIFGERSFVLEE